MHRTIMYAGVPMRNLLCLVVPVVLLCARTQAQLTGQPRGWLVIEGGSFPMNAVVAAKFRELVGGEDSKVLVVPTALADADMKPESSTDGAKPPGDLFGIRNLEVFNTHDR